MATFIMLGTYTEQGLKAIKDTIKRKEAIKDMAKKAGVTFKDSYWTLGAFDLVALFEAPDDDTMTAFALSVAKLGNVNTQTLRGFSSAEMKKILDKMV